MKPELVKEVVQEEDRPTKIAALEFGLLDGSDIMRLSEFHVTHKELFKMPTRIPAENGVLDKRLGVCNKRDTCQTCNEKIKDCVGHFGYIQLALPVFHVGYFKHTIGVLQSICKSCSRVLLSGDTRTKYLRIIKNSKLEWLQKRNIRSAMIDLCKKVKRCPYCDAINGVVKKVPNVHWMKIVHDKYKDKQAADEKDVVLNSFEEVKNQKKDVAPFLNKLTEDMNALVVYELFKRIPECDVPLLVMTLDNGGRPERLLQTHILVPPVCIRPSVAMDAGAGSNEDDLTIELKHIIELNQCLRNDIEKGAKTAATLEHWNILQYQCAKYINGEIHGLPQNRESKPIRGLVQRLKGKAGRFRGNLSGKRVNFSGRTVISPDPNLSVEQVGVPEDVARRLTYPERVTPYNIEWLRQLIRNGPEKHPGAMFVRKIDKKPQFLLYGDLNLIADSIAVGDIVERHLIDNDVALFNRQPSLHKMSIMAHRVKVLKSRTFRFNECVCAPYNADFDGDEMNLHVPQTEEARIDALTLMRTRNNFITPRNGEPLVCANQDFLTSSFIMSQKDIFMTRDQFCQVLSFLGDASERIILPLPAILRPVELWTGKQVYKLLLRPNDASGVEVNLELKARNYKGPKVDPKNQLHNAMCPKDGYVIFKNSELICGNLCKKTLGGSKEGLIFTLCNDHSNVEAAHAMNRLTKMCTRWLTTWGFSIGIDDVTPSPTFNVSKQAIIDEKYAVVDELIRSYQKGTLELRAGCDLVETLESQVSGNLSEVREKVGKKAMEELPKHNSPFIMATCGSKGSQINISQMVACVGQQIVNGKRIAEGFIERTLPHFQRKEFSPAAKGFVCSSFYSGLSGPEFFFHTMGGREGLVDTAVKTAETGYMQRRLMKALEDLVQQYDNTVRSFNNVVQFTYGDDGLNPKNMENNGRPVNFFRLLDVIKNTHPYRPDVDEDLFPFEIRQIGAHHVALPEFQRLLPEGKKFIEEVSNFCETLAASIEFERSSLGMPLMSSESEKKISNDLYKRPNFVLNFNKKKHDSLFSATQDWVQKVKKQDPQAVRELTAIILHNTKSVTRNQMNTLMKVALNKIIVSQMEPGEAVGAIAAQSIGEPATQMTLKTFHFAGVASMNVTLGVPRIKEIINATANISTPIITAELNENAPDDATLIKARRVKAQLETTTLGEISIEIKETYNSEACYLDVKLDLLQISLLHLKVTNRSAVESILRDKKLKLKPEYVQAMGQDSIRVFPARASSSASQRNANKNVRGNDAYFILQSLKTTLPNVIVQGIPSISRAVINKSEGNDKEGTKARVNLLVEGRGLLDVLGKEGVDASKTESNHILEVEQVLGIEASRSKIMAEVRYTYSSYGMDIDARHLMLLADVMTYKGMILGITRFGIAKMKESVLMLASFEKTADHLFDGGAHGRTDTIEGVSECIIMGLPIPLGSGLFTMVHKPAKTSKTKKSPPVKLLIS